MVKRSTVTRKEQLEKRSVACAAQMPLWGRINFPQLLGVLLEWLLAEELCFTQALPSFQEQPLSHPMAYV